uniref:CX domain-containing protein n=1 Tax=Loa loa TaxID=7209 RepID=A0A1I7VUV2_LOALO
MKKLTGIVVYLEKQELSNTFIENSEEPVNHITWICPSNGWCCGAECCQYYYKDPWPLLGPDFYELIAAVAVFAGLLVIPELYRRWRQRKMDNLTIPAGTSGYIMENPENAKFIV